MTTFREFLNKIGELDGGVAKFHFEDWMETATKEQYLTRFGEEQLTDALALRFYEDIRLMIRERLFGICTDALYNRTYNEGHAFLKDIHRIANESGLEIDLNQPLTITDALSAADLIKIGDKGEITPKYS